MKVLVGYATAHGSTRGIAERIAARLVQAGIGTDVHALAEVANPTEYDALVIGSAVHGSRWLPDADHFVERFASDLRTRPTWLFSVSTVGDAESMFSPAVGARLRKLRKETAEITSVRARLASREHRNFAGTIRRSDWSMTGRAAFRAMGGRYGDHRNWSAIDTWADHIAAQLADDRTPAPGRASDR